MGLAIVRRRARCAISCDVPELGWAQGSPWMGRMGPGEPLDGTDGDRGPGPCQNG